jgi:hypothetical protein
MHARGKLLFLVLFCFLLLTTGRCCNNKITCVWGSIRGKACMACVKAKQQCGVFGGEEKRLLAESAVLGEVTTILQDIVEVLRGICTGMRGLEEAFDGHWIPMGNEEESDKEEGGESELYKDGRNMPEELEKEKKKEKEKKGEEGDKIEVDGMVMGLLGSVD